MPPYSAFNVHAGDELGSSWCAANMGRVISSAIFYLLDECVLEWPVAIFLFAETSGSSVLGYKVFSSAFLLCEVELKARTMAGLK